MELATDGPRSSPNTSPLCHGALDDARKEALESHTNRVHYLSSVIK